MLSSDLEVTLWVSYNDYVIINHITLNPGIEQRLNTYLYLIN